MNNKICLILILLNFWINQNKNRIHSFYLIMRQNILFSFGVRQIMILWEYSPGSDRMTCTTKKGRSPKAAPFLKTIITIQPRGCLKKIKISVFFCKQRRILVKKNWNPKGSLRFSILHSQAVCEEFGIPLLSNKPKWTTAARLALFWLCCVVD